MRAPKARAKFLNILPDVQHLGEETGQIIVDLFARLEGGGLLEHPQHPLATGLDRVQLCDNMHVCRLLLLFIKFWFRLRCQFQFVICSMPGLFIV